jgi:cytochrome c-type protein NapC
MAPTNKPGLIRRLLSWLFKPSARWSVFVLLLAGAAVGFASVVGTQVAVAVTGTNDFCGNACHSHAKFVYPEYKASVHGSNRTGVKATCSDCHIPHSYPAKLFYKAEAGIRDGFAEMRGVISTQEKFEAERWRMANHVWDEMKANNSANCRHCHTPESMDAAKQSKDAVKQHKKFTDGKATCIECHTGVAHAEPVEPEAAKPASAGEPSTPNTPAGAASAAAPGAPALEASTPASASKP